MSGRRGSKVSEYKHIFLLWLGKGRLSCGNGKGLERQRSRGFCLFLMNENNLGQRRKQSEILGMESERRGIIII